MFIEVKMNRGPEVLNTHGILRIVPIGENKTRAFLFGVPQPIDIDEPITNVKAKLYAATGKEVA